MDLAFEDYTRITEYLSQFYPSTSQNFLTALEKQTTLLQETSDAFGRYQPKPQYRSMVVSDYLVFYKVIEGTQTVEIHRILHGARNIKRFLK